MNDAARDELARILDEDLEDRPLARRLADRIVSDIDWAEVDR